MLSKSINFLLQSVDSGVKNFVFIKTTLENPAELSDTIFADLHKTRTAKSRFICKFIPVVGSCKADADKLRIFALDMLDKHLKGVDELTYSLNIKIRNNKDMTRNQIMDIFTQAMSDLKPRSKVHLGNPQYVVMINVIKRVLCVSILKDFVKYSKYNLQQLVATEEPKASEDSENVTDTDQDTPKAEKDAPILNEDAPKADIDAPKTDATGTDKDAPNAETDATNDETS